MTLPIAYSSRHDCVDCRVPVLHLPQTDDVYDCKRWSLSISLNISSDARDKRVFLRFKSWIAFAFPELRFIPCCGSGETHKNLRLCPLGCLLEHHDPAKVIVDPEDDQPEPLAMDKS
jgi:hypothetical protein